MPSTLNARDAALQATSPRVQTIVLPPQVQVPGPNILTKSITAEQVQVQSLSLDRLQSGSSSSFGQGSALQFGLNSEYFTNSAKTAGYFRSLFSGLFGAVISNEGGGTALAALTSSESNDNVAGAILAGGGFSPVDGRTKSLAVLGRGLTAGSFEGFDSTYSTAVPNSFRPATQAFLGKPAEAGRFTNYAGGDSLLAVSTGTSTTGAGAAGIFGGGFNTVDNTFQASAYLGRASIAGQFYGVAVGSVAAQFFNLPVDFYNPLVEIAGAYSLHVKAGVLRHGSVNIQPPPGTTNTFLRGDGQWGNFENVSNGTGTAGFTATNKPGASNNNTWMTVYMGGKLVTFPVWDV